MKSLLKYYLMTFIIILIPSLFISLILSTMSYFIQMNGILFDIFLQIIAYIILFISALYLSSKLTNSRLIHCTIMSLLYMLFHLCIHIDSINIINLALKSSIFIIVGTAKEYMQKKRWLLIFSYEIYSIFKILTS